MSGNPQRRSIIELLLVIAATSLVLVLAKEVLRRVDPLTFVWLQLLVGVLLLSGYTFGVQRYSWRLQLPARLWFGIAAMGVLNFTLVRWLWLAALQLLPVTTHSYLINFTAIVTMVLSALILREWPNLWQIIGVMIAFAGVQLYFGQLPGTDEWRGIVYLGIGIVALALVNIVTRCVMTQNDRHIPATVVATYTLLFGSYRVIFRWHHRAQMPLALSPLMGRLQSRLGWWYLTVHCAICAPTR